MPFNFNSNQLAYNPMAQATLDRAGTSPFKIAGEAMTNLDNALENRIFNRDVQSVDSLDRLATMRVPQTPEAMAQFKQKSDALNQIATRKQAQKMFDLQNRKFEYDQQGQDIVNSMAQVKLNQYNDALSRLGKNQISTVGTQNEANQQGSPVLNIGGKPMVNKETTPFSIYGDTLEGIVQHQSDLATVGIGDKVNLFPNSSMSGAKRDMLKQMEDAFIATNPNPTPEQVRNFYGSALVKMQEGGKAVSEDKAIVELSQEYNKAKEFRDKFGTNPNKATSFDLGEMRKTETKSMQLLDTNAKKSTQGTVDSMKGNQIFISGATKVLNDWSDGKISNVEKGAYDNTVQKLRSVFGENLSEEQATKMAGNIDFNSKSGRLLGAYMKATSGLAVSDKEREFLSDLFTGGFMDDENAVKNRMVSFVNSMKDENDILAGQVFDTAPFSATKFRQYDELKSGTNIKVSEPIKNSDGTIMFNGKKYDASGKLIG